jgi:hypothetical protein
MGTEPADFKCVIPRCRTIGLRMSRGSLHPGILASSDLPPLLKRSMEYLWNIQQLGGNIQQLGGNRFKKPKFHPVVSQFSWIVFWKSEDWKLNCNTLQIFSPCPRLTARASSAAASAVTYPTWNPEVPPTLLSVPSPHGTPPSTGPEKSHQFLPPLWTPAGTWIPHCKRKTHHWKKKLFLEGWI